MGIKTAFDFQHADPASIRKSMGVVVTCASQGNERSGKENNGWRMKSERHSPHYTTDWNQLPEARIGS
jgi:hypothetical protein